MGVVDEVKNKIPGLQFRIEEATKGSRTVSGTQHGIIKLRAEFTDVKLWEEAVARLDGFKVTNSLVDEMIDALGEELTKTAETLEESQARCRVLEQEKADKDTEIERLRGLLRSIEHDF